MFAAYLIVSEEVRNALASNKAVVALESTIISHGMPYPQNLETARRVEQTIREEGAVPATIAVMNGKIHIGLSDDELTFFAQAKDVMKLSRRDLPFALAQKKMGATTVSATMIAAEMAGIEIFVTGGIGGVHRGVETTWDVSADLIELAQTNVSVICAGAKSILDLSKTMEYLETFGVPVVGFGTKELPAFYSRNSGIPLHMHVDSPKQLADLIATKRSLSLKGGVLVVNPIPATHSIDFSEMESSIDLALAAAKKNNMIGKDLTPFLLKFIKMQTEGKSLDANIELVLNNARVGATTAIALMKNANRS